jgi:hypothetical protein
MSRDRHERFSIGRRRLARDVAGILSVEIERGPFRLGVTKVLAA